MPAVFFSGPQRFKYQKGVGHRCERDMVMPARPRAPFKVIEPEFVLEFAIVLFDAPAPFRQTDEATQAERFVWHAGQPVLDRRRLVRWPFDEQLHRHGRERSTTADAVRGLGGHLKSGH